jgi:hypothetical protein
MEDRKTYTVVYKPSLSYLDEDGDEVEELLEDMPYAEELAGKVAEKIVEYHDGCARLRRVGVRIELVSPLSVDRKYFISIQFTGPNIYRSAHFLDELKYHLVADGRISVRNRQNKLHHVLSYVSFYITPAGIAVADEDARDKLREFDVSYREILSSLEAIGNMGRIEPVGIEDGEDQEEDQEEDHDEED